MDVGKVGTSQNTTTQVSSQAKAAVKAENIAAAAKTDRVEISSRNPANKKELMATYSGLRTQMPQMRNQAILSSAAGGSAALNFTAPQVVTRNNTAATAPNAPAPAPANTGNAVHAPRGFERGKNKATVTGSNNTVNVTGALHHHNTLDVNGTGNKVNVGNAVSNANVKVTGNNVTVNMADNQLATNKQNNWNVAVNASNVNVTVENGKAVVTGANGSNQGLNIQIDNEKRTVMVTAATPQTADNTNPANPLT
jgi:hypothetical protein